jgi:hypothetical protein
VGLCIRRVQKCVRYWIGAHLYGVRHTMKTVPIRRTLNQKCQKKSSFPITKRSSSLLFFSSIIVNLFPSLCHSTKYSFTTIR